MRWDKGTGSGDGDGEGLEEGGNIDSEGEQDRPALKGRGGAAVASFPARRLCWRRYTLWS